MVIGRPTLRTPELEAKILEAINDGHSLRLICKDAGMPNRATVHEWLVGDKAFADRYARAREGRAEKMADEILEISDGSVGEDSNGINSARLRVDARKWLASKMDPRTYGDRVSTELSGPNGGPVQVQTLADLVRLANSPEEPKP